MTPTLLTPEPEYALLLDAVAPLASPRADHRSWDPGSWGRLLNIADWHRLSPTLFKHLKVVGGAPAPVLSALERAYFANAAHSAFIRETTTRAINALDECEVRSILLKGTALVETVYADPAEREMLDIDVLVPEDQIDEATAALAKLGHLPRVDPEVATHSETDHSAAAAAKPLHGAPLVGPEQLAAIELHRHIALSDEESSFDLAGLWQRARVVPKTGHGVPSPEDLLIHVCFHFTRNRLGGSAHRRNTGGALAQIMDIQRLVTNEAIDWSLLTRTAHEFGLGKRVYLGLFAASELGIPISGAAIEPIRPNGFDPDIGRRLVTLRVLRAGDHLPVRSMRWMVAPSREALRRGWNADPNATLSLARAYMRRAKAHVPEARSAMRRPWIYLQDQRLNGQIEALKERA
jgi:Uncharacterised nucleotidyltransferase